MTDVIVVGGGAMGSAAAWHLAESGREVTVLEQFEPGHVRGSSHGASRVFRIAYPDELYVDLAREAVPVWRRLEELTGAELLTVTGGIDHGPRETVAPILQALESLGVTHEALTPEAAAERWPQFVFDEVVAYQADAGRVHADRTVAACQQAALSAGAELRPETPVRRLRVVRDDLVEVDTDDGVLRAPVVVIAAGSWTAKLLADAVELPRLTVTVEQPAHFAAVGSHDWPSFLHYSDPDRQGAPGGFGSYGLATPGDGIKVGLHGTGVVSDPDERSFEADPAGMDALVRYVEHWIPGVDPSTAEPISCLYTTTGNEDFIVDRHGPLVVGAGFSGHGFKFVPIIGRLLADLAMGGEGRDPRLSLTDRAPTITRRRSGRLDGAARRRR